MAARVVDGLEAVEVEHQHRDAAPRRDTALQSFVELLVEVAPVRQTGQRVVTCQPLCCAFGGPSGGNFVFEVLQPPESIDQQRAREHSGHDKYFVESPVFVLLGPNYDVSKQIVPVGHRQRDNGGTSDDEPVAYVAPPPVDGTNGRGEAAKQWNSIDATQVQPPQVIRMFWARRRC